MERYQRRSVQDKREMFQRRQDGQSLQQIADAYGISRQAVKSCLCSYQHLVDGYRGNKFHINQIPYQGIYDYFLQNEDLSVSSFCEQVFGRKEGAMAVKMRNFLSGDCESRFSVEEMDKICSVIGLTFEQVFQRRIDL